MSRTTDYVIDKGIDLTDPREPSLDECQQILKDDEGYIELLDLLDEERFEEIMNEPS